MKTQELFNVLQEHNDKALLFEYAPSKFVGANYHITEVKHTTIDAVDCGANTDAWNETVIQLWESPKELGKRDFMKVSKAMEIFDRVASMKSYDLDAEVKFEYSNASFHTAQLFINDFDIQGNNLIIKLAVKKTDCKAKSTCGVEEKEAAFAQDEACCSPVENCC